MNDERRRVPYAYEDAPKILSQIEEFYPNLNTRLLILVRTTKNIHEKALNQKLVQKPLQVKVSSNFLEAMEPLDETEYIEGVKTAEELISKATSNPYWQYCLVRNILLVAVEKAALKRGKNFGFGMGSYDKDKYEHIVISDQEIPEAYE
ncbi:MAG TPA: hypothetical protein VIK81_00170 [Patescibacteria group bacterium]